VLELNDVHVWLESGTVLLEGIDWTVRAGDQWALLGPNGAGKSTLLSIIRANRFPSRGSVKVLGRTFGGSDLWPLREQIGHVDSQQKVLEWLDAEDVVLTGLTGSIQPIWNRYGPDETERAKGLLDIVGASALIGRAFETCSQGEKQRIRIARALMSDPALLLLDEPTTGLDLPAREALLSAISTLTESHPGLATVIVSHHLEELPATTSDAMLLRHGHIVAIGESDATLTTENVSNCFGFPVTVRREDGRWFARATGSWSASAE
jgi:iron complex transport system ATP-binding protein